MNRAQQAEQLAGVLGQKYQLLCHIGGGGMAQVFLARHRLHGGLVAIKVLAEHLAQDPSIVSRFEQEARTAASLASHPNVVPIYDIGEGEGLHYIVMQYIAGEDLASLVRRTGRLSPPVAANIIAQAAEALSCAEAKHIVHRDLKPANMLLDEGGRIKLLDFGISRVVDLADGLTRPGESLGTPFYMSPEQIRGEACDVRSDLYALGVIFFELLAGRRPFENESATAIQMAHLSSPPPSLLQLDPALPSACETMVAKLMSKRREDRYQSTRELIDDLAAHGAQAGPSVLRPQVPPALCEAVTQAESTPPLPPATRVQSAPATITSDVPPPTLPSAPPASGHVPDGSASKSDRSRLPAVLAGSAAVLVLALAAAGFSLLRGKHQAAAPPPASTSAALASSLDDANGRMLLVPAGSFTFAGGSGATPQQLSLPAFYVDETEVSNAEYRQFVSATGHAAPQSADYAAHPDYPVTGVSHADATAFAAWAGKRLPSEAEWEKAARGTGDRPYPWGSEAWSANVPVGLQPVTSSPDRRSPVGAYNMGGNAWEWTVSEYAYTQAEAASMRKLLAGQPFSAQWYNIKGGSFAPGSHDFSIDNHRPLPADARSPWIGFRCVRDAPRQ